MCPKTSLSIIHTKTAMKPKARTTVRATNCRDVPQTSSIQTIKLWCYSAPKPILLSTQQTMYPNTKITIHKANYVPQHQHYCCPHTNITVAPTPILISSTQDTVSVWRTPTPTLLLPQSHIIIHRRHCESVMNPQPALLYWKQTAITEQAPRKSCSCFWWKSFPHCTECLIKLQACHCHGNQ